MATMYLELNQSAHSQDRLTSRHGEKRYTSQSIGASAQRGSNYLHVDTLERAARCVGYVRNNSGRLLLVEMLVFMAVLAVGYIYIWKRGALQWD